MSEGVSTGKSLFQHLVNIFIHVQAKEEDVEAEEKRRKEMESAIKANMENPRKEYYDSKHAIGDTFTIGSLVLKKDFRRRKRKGGMMDYRWQGPFVIISRLGKGLYRLKHRDEDRVIYIYKIMY